MTQNNSGKEGRNVTVSISEVAVEPPNPPGTFNFQESQDNSITLQNAAKAAEIVNNLKQK